nr:zinc finger BED domain-containing protein DAYSLEEPER-like [Ipomoea trifida]GLL41674.1 zinc finger BED domain-containing protein DAYSLEEPER-like [Ipomoea trifida]GLL42359.1 zinc finger BED domain-containing protein DAYSLEEPER-like [Ipomoea trifida]GLL45203.1 zinc finger BED domain-containing protein DAYSLEEPER-like [Ipomoea trifida]
MIGRLEMDTSQQQSSPNTNINVDCEVDMPGDTPVEVEPSEQTENLETQERDPNTYKQKLDYVKRKLYMLFEAYKSKSMTAAPSSSTLTTSCENARIEETSDELIDEFVEYCNQDDLDNGKSALDVYLDEPQKDMKMFGDMDILNFWKENRHRFGELSYMACDILSIPITTVASESAFSIGGHVLNKYRNCMLPSNVQALLCARNWIRDDGDGVEEIVPVPTEFSGVTFIA